MKIMRSIDRVFDRVLDRLFAPGIDPDPPPCALFACEKCGAVRSFMPEDGLCRTVYQGDVGNTFCCFGTVVRLEEAG